MDLKFEVYAKIKKPLAEVFNAVYHHDHLSGYFTTGGASAPLDKGTVVTWSFHDFPGAFPVTVKDCVRDVKIVFSWEGEPGKNTLVEILFEAIDETATLVKVRESGWDATQKSLDLSYGNCMGWSQMLCALKVYLEYGKNLREFMY